MDSPIPEDDGSGVHIVLRSRIHESVPDVTLLEIAIYPLPDVAVMPLGLFLKTAAMHWLTKANIVQGDEEEVIPMGKPKH